MVVTMRATLTMLVVVVLTAATSLVGAASAHATTEPPTLQWPASNSSYALNANIDLNYGMSAAAEGTGRLLITPLGDCADDGATLLRVPVAQSYSYFLAANNLNSGSFFGLTVESGPTTLAENCQYSFTLSYQNVSLDPAAESTNTPITIDSGTSAPTLNSPATSSIQSYSGVAVSFTLPDEPLNNSIQLALTPIDSCSGAASTLDLAGNSVRSLTLDPTNLANAAEVALVTGPTTVTSGCRYDISVSYQDSRGNPRASATNADIQIGEPPDGPAPTTSPAPTASPSPGTPSPTPTLSTSPAPTASTSPPPPASPTPVPALRVGQTKTIARLLKAAGKPVSKRMRPTTFRNKTRSVCRYNSRNRRLTGLATGTCRGMVVLRPKTGNGRLQRVKLAVRVA